MNPRGKWSIADVVAHLDDLELIYVVRIRTILSGVGDASPLPVLAQNRWVERVLSITRFWQTRSALTQVLVEFDPQRNHPTCAVRSRVISEA